MRPKLRGLVAVLTLVVSLELCLALPLLLPGCALAPRSGKAESEIDRYPVGFYPSQVYGDALSSLCPPAERSIPFASIGVADRIPEGLMLFSGVHWVSPDGYVYQRVQRRADQPLVVLSVVENMAEQKVRVHVAPADALAEAETGDGGGPRDRVNAPPRKQQPAIWVRFLDAGLPVEIVPAPR